MWTSVDLFTKAKTSVPVLLYTTEQICVAHFMVYVFRRWHARLNKKHDLESIGDTEGLPEMTENPNDHSMSENNNAPGMVGHSNENEKI